MDGLLSGYRSDAYDEMVPNGSHDPEADPFFPRYRGGR